MRSLDCPAPAAVDDSIDYLAPVGYFDQGTGSDSAAVVLAGSARVTAMRRPPPSAGAAR